MTINRTLFEKHNASEGYAEDDARNSDAVDVRGLYVQNDTSNDTSVVITRDASGNLTFTDPVLGLTKTLTQLAAGASGVIYGYDFLLDNEPTAATGGTDATYTPTYSGSKVTRETWTNNAAKNIKTIDYTYSGNKVLTEVRKAYMADGVTVQAQVTWTYTYSGNTVTSATMVRNV